MTRVGKSAQAPAAPTAKPGQQRPQTQQPANTSDAGPEKTPEQKKAEAKARAKAKRDANRRVIYPGLEPKDQAHPRTGKVMLRATKRLESVPADYDPKRHRPLGKADFADESVFLEMKAQELDKKAADLRRQAADVKALGSIKDRAAAKKLLSLQKRMDELMAEVAGSGVDITAIKAKLADSMKRKAEAAEASRTETQKA